MKKTNKLKLALTKQTLRPLTSKDLVHAVGGMPLTGNCIVGDTNHESCTCNHTNYGC